MNLAQPFTVGGSGASRRAAPGSREGALPHLAHGEAATRVTQPR